MKMTKRERKIYNQGKAAGFIDGYAKGLHDGKPFTVLAEALGNTLATVRDIVNEKMQDPEFVKMVEEAKKAEIAARIAEFNANNDMTEASYDD